MLTFSAYAASELNGNAPTSISYIYTHHEHNADGVDVYFELGDNNGTYATSDGMLNVKVTMPDNNPYLPRIHLFEANYTVAKSDFTQTKVRVGPITQDIIIYNIGRIAYSSMKPDPNSLMYGDTVPMGTVNIRFTLPNGQVLKGKETFVIFS